MQQHLLHCLLFIQRHRQRERHPPPPVAGREGGPSATSRSAGWSPSIEDVAMVHRITQGGIAAIICC